MDRLSTLQEINIVAQIADIKESLYKNTLGLTALIDCLVDKGLITYEDIQKKASQLEIELLDGIK